MLQDCGIDALAIHPRLQTQKFEGKPDYALVAQVKQAVTIPAHRLGRYCKLGNGENGL